MGFRFLSFGYASLFGRVAPPHSFASLTFVWSSRPAKLFYQYLRSPFLPSPFVLSAIDLKDEPDATIGVHKIGLEEPDIIGVRHSDSG
jgi:hypothetical protein